MTDPKATISLPVMNTSPEGAVSGPADSGTSSNDQPGQPGAQPSAHAADQGNARGPSVYLETFGCQMNVLDSQLVTAQLRGLGYRFTDHWESADVVLYNTCSVREQAENKALSRVGRVGQLKRERPDLVLGVIGCMAERDGADMIRRHPQIDLLCGPGELDKLPMLIDNVVRTAPERRGGPEVAEANGTIALQGSSLRRSATLDAARDDLEQLDLSRSFAPEDNLAQGRSAYVRITRGCNKFCTYCVVPNTRGREVHRPPNAIIDECRKLVEAGVIEITLLGQTVNHYHFDEAHAVAVDGIVQPQIGRAVKNTGNGALGDQRPWESATTTSFAQLLARIHDELPELQRLRFVTSFPRDFGDDILDVMAQRPRLCKYFHLPVQSGSNDVLKGMNRGYTVEEYVDLIDRIRVKMPEAEIATDLICGFPGETEADHQATMALVNRCQFKSSFIFKYSPRPGTTAYGKLPDDIPDEVKRRRNQELLQLQADVGRDRHASYIGKTVRVFVEGTSSRVGRGASTAEGREATEASVQMSGRTEHDLIVCFNGDPSMVGTMVDVKVEQSAPLVLVGERV